MDTATSVRDLLFTLLLKVGVASSFAALLARWNTFRRVLFTEERDVDQKLKLMMFMVPPLIVGVMLRLVGPAYKFADLSLEGAFLMGLLGGRVVGPIGGAIITIPALISHEWLAMPAASTAGLLGGLIRQAIPNKEDLWNFGPFTFLNIPKATVKLLRKAELSWEMAPLTTCIGLELGRVALVEATKPKWLFAIDARWDWWLALTVIATLMSVAAPLKIWNNTRIEMNLERHQQLLLKARMDALSSQINPHFLFNTLNTVSSLIRFDPDAARGVVLKLSNILRRLLRKHETFVPLREELHFKARYFNVQVIVDEMQFLAQRHKCFVLAQQPPQNVAQLQHHAARRVRIKTDQRRHGIQRVEQKVRIDLARKRVHARLEQQLLVLLQVHFNARVVPDLQRRRHRHQRGQHAQSQPPVPARLDRKQPPGFCGHRQRHAPKFQSNAREQRQQFPRHRALPHQAHYVARNIQKRERPEVPKISLVGNRLAHQAAEQSRRGRRRHGQPFVRGQRRNGYNRAANRPHHAAAQQTHQERAF